MPESRAKFSLSENALIDFPVRVFLKNHLNYNLITDQQYQFLLANNSTIGVNKILKFENLENDLNEISNKININIKHFKKMNASTFDDYKNYYDLETK